MLKEMSIIGRANCANLIISTYQKRKKNGWILISKVFRLQKNSNIPQKQAGPKSPALYKPLNKPPEYNPNYINKHAGIYLSAFNDVTLALFIFYRIYSTRWGINCSYLKSILSLQPVSVDV